MPLRIMVVDDEPLSLKVMRTLGGSLGHIVLTFNDSQQAKLQAEKQRFDVVFVGLPRSDGLDLAHTFGEPQPGSETIVVMLGPENDTETLRKSFGAGATFFLPKPIASTRVVPFLKAMSLTDWKTRRHAARLPFVTEVNCKSASGNFPMRSVNISETGMLLQSLHDVGLGQAVSLEFKIAEIRASLNVHARVVRKEGTDHMAVAFVDLAPEDQNAIQLCVMGRVKPPASTRDFANFRSIRLYDS
jgi:CheY-like chemotaxis protein